MHSLGMLIVVPARGGSKRLPQKNTRLLGGRSLIQRTAALIREAGFRDAHALLSTDDTVAAAQAQAEGLAVPFMRPANLATGDASSVDVVLHALAFCRDTLNKEPETIMLLQPTSPFRQAAHLHKARQLLEPDTDAVVTVSRTHVSARHLFLADEYMCLMPNRLPSEAYEDRYWYPNGAVYLIRTHVFERGKHFFPNRLRGLDIGTIAGLDIDDAEDWAIADALRRYSEVDA